VVHRSVTCRSLGGATIHAVDSGDIAPDADPAAQTPPAESSTALARRSIGGFLWTTLAWGSNRIVILGLTLLLARLLTPEDFGVVTAAVTIIAMLDAALDLGVGAAVVARQEHGITPATRMAMTLNLGISAGVCVAGIAASPWIAELFDAGSQADLFALLFLYPLFRGAGQVSDAVLKRDLLFRRRTAIDLTRAAVRVCISVPLALTIGGAISIAAGIVGGELVAMLLLWILVPIRPAFLSHRHLIPGLLRFGGLVTVIRVLGSIRASADYLVVGAMLGTTALGYYGMAYKLPELLIENVLWIFSTVALSAYSRAKVISAEVLTAGMLRATRILSIYGLTAGAILAVIAPEAVPVLFSPQWAPAVTPMVLISLALGFMAVGWASGDVFTANGRPGTLVALDIPATVILIAGFVVAADHGLVGVALALLIFNLLYCVARLALVRYAHGTSWIRLLTAVAPAVVIAAVTGGVGLLVRSFLPSGQFVTLVLVSVACTLTAIGASLVFARSTVVELAGLVRRRGGGPG
jgi:lipopolysaccharide exporter